MDTKIFIDELKKNEINFFTGIPDSQLKNVCDYLNSNMNSSDHIVAENEGGCIALAAGYHLATGKVPCVYMQNSGIGNAVNPLASLANEKVYGIPLLLIIGWRGEPGIKDEPQHLFQGEITLKLLETLDIDYCVMDGNTTIEVIREELEAAKKIFSQGKSYAFVIQKGAFTNDGEKKKFENNFILTREQAISILLSEQDEDDVVISTTGKCSREVFEQRTIQKQSHEKDFLTVGSMGHCSLIALEIALQKNQKKVWCLDGDGAALMHMGAMAIIGDKKPTNYIHIIFNNGAHESVGGFPTGAVNLSYAQVAMALGYQRTIRCFTQEELRTAIDEVKKSKRLVMIEIMVAIGARSDLGRPTSTTYENKAFFMGALQE